MLLLINPFNPQERLIKQAVDILQKDGVIIYPTDTTYSFACSIRSKKAMKRIYQLKNIDKKQPLTFICNDTKQFQEYTRGISSPVFRSIKSQIPGPYTFIFEASKLIPKVLLSPRATIGVRIPDAEIPQKIVELLGEPILSSSIPLLEEDGLFHDPSHLHEHYKKLVDCTIDGGEVYIQ
ncbi:MAG: tRNA threonylcarbamoyl adenosine modification protein (Sua5/YciO/YrdC/YwlC family), partial [bacterium]